MEKTPAPDDGGTGFVRPGRLVRPGVIGRAVRLLLGLASAWLVFDNLLRFGPAAWLTDEIGPVQTNVGTLIGVGIGLWVFTEVVNIGWGRRWGSAPLVVLLATAGAVALLGLLLTGSAWTPLLGGLTYAWLLYTFTHLGISFLLAAVLATPGCEMRSIPQLLARLRGRDYREHACPSPLHTLDVWERRDR